MQAVQLYVILLLILEGVSPAEQVLLDLLVSIFSNWLF